MDTADLLDPSEPMPPLQGVWGALARVACCVDRIIGVLCQNVLYLTTLIVFLILSANVILRYTRGTSLAWASELPELLFPWMIVSGVVIAAQHGSHISVVIITQRLSETLRAWVLSLGSLIIILLYGYMAIIALPLMEIAHDERSSVLNVPGSVTVLALMIGFSLLVVVTVIRLPKFWCPNYKAYLENRGGHA